MWAPDHKIFQPLDRRAKLLAAGEAGQASSLALALGSGWVFHTTQVRMDSSATSGQEVLPELLRDGFLHAGWRTSRHTLVSSSRHYQNMLLHNRLYLNRWFNIDIQKLDSSVLKLQLSVWQGLIYKSNLTVSVNWHTFSFRVPV